MPTWEQMESKKKYPELSGGNMLLKKEEKEDKPPIDCIRLQRTRDCPTGVKISAPEDAVKLMREMEGYDRERAMILHLSTKNQVLAVENISIGSLNAAIIHPRESIKGAVINSAANIIFLHNHPSGDPAPSVEDRAIVKKLIQAFDTVGIIMLDSIIIGKEQYYSFKEHGEMFPESKYKESKPGERIMEKLEEKDACEVATAAALSVIRERCGAESDEETIEALVRQAELMIEKAEKIDKISRAGLDRQLQYYKDNMDAEGILKFVDYLKTWVDSQD